jgi:hypothetical protein
MNIEWNISSIIHFSGKVIIPQKALFNHEASAV